MLYRIILCATDGQQHSERALRRAAEMAVESRGELHVVHVPEPEPDVAMLRSTDYAEAMRTERERAIRGEIARLNDDLRELTVVPHFLRGNAGTVPGRIAELAERIDADVIIVGARRRSALGAAIMGSTSRRLMGQTRRPVLMLGGDGARPGSREPGRLRSDRPDGPEPSTAAAGPLETLRHSAPIQSLRRALGV